MRRVLVTAVLSALVVLAAAPAHAELIRVTPIGFTPGQYEAAGFPTDPAIIGGDGFRLTYWGGGKDTLADPVMLVFAIPDGSEAPLVTPVKASGMDLTKVSAGIATDLEYGGQWNTATGSAGTFDSTSNPKVYDFIGFTPAGSDSQNYTNWTGATGLTSWNLFVYSVSFSPSVWNHGDYVEFSTSLPLGSYVIGYGCDSVTKGLCTGSDSTPFTFAGLVAPPPQVPEPTSLALIVSGGALVLARVRRPRL